MPGVGIGISPVFRRGGVQSLGDIFTDDFARASLGTDYANTSGAFACDGTQLVASFAGGGIWTNRLSYNKDGYTSCLEKFTQTVEYNVGTLTNGAYGIAVGVLSTAYDFQSILFLSPDVLFGQIRFYTDTGATVLGTSVGAMTLSNNDDIRAVLTRDKNYFSVTYTNLTTSEVLTMDYTFALTYPAGGIFSPRVYNPTLFCTGGTQYINLWEETSGAVVNAPYVFIGDSITAGYFANTANNRWAELAGGTIYNIYAGPGNFSNEINSTEVIALNPTTAVICLGTNDKMSAVADATIITRIGTLRTALQNAGITVYVCQIPPNDTVDMTSINADIVSNFGAGPDFFTLLKGGGTAYAVGKSPDGIHPANTVQQDMADEVLSYL